MEARTNSGPEFSGRYFTPVRLDDEGRQAKLSYNPIEVDPAYNVKLKVEHS